MFRVAVMLLAALLAAWSPASAAAAAQPGPQPLKPVQVFDVARGKVVATIDNDDVFQAHARSWLAGVTGVSAKVQPEDKCGYVFRVPLREPVAVSTGSVKLTAAEVFLFYCPGEAPRLLAIDTSRKAYFLELKAELGPFLEKTGVPTL